MGQKCNPKILRIPIIRSWESKWFAEPANFKKFLKEDIQVRKFIQKKLKNAGIDKINIERSRNDLKIIIHTAKPGVVIGRGGADIDKIKKEIKDKFLDKKNNLEISVQEVSAPMLCAQVILEPMIADIENRIHFRRVLKKAIDQVRTAGAAGVKINIGGRLGGAEIARREALSWGKMPLHTLRADIDYARGTAHTIYGAIGLKIWIYRGEIFNKK
ncbi:MAG: 30S ribosomal protein S3 [Patescibacteria group bacterium]